MCWSFLVSLVDRDSTLLVVSDGDRDLRRVEGGSLTADDCDCDLFKIFSTAYSLDLHYKICNVLFLS